LQLTSRDRIPAELLFGPEATVPLAELRRDWLRHILHGAPPPEFLRDRVLLYLAGAERWISAPSLEAASTESVTRYLRSVDGPMDATHSGFVEDAPTAGPDATFSCDPFDLRTHEVELQPRPAGSGPESPFHGQPMNSFVHVVGGNDPTNPRFVLDLDGQGVVYTSRVLADDISIVGEPELHLRLVCDQPDADLAVLLHEVTPMGDSIFLSSDVLRLSCRDLDGTQARRYAQEMTQAHGVPVTQAAQAGRARHGHGVGQPDEERAGSEAARAGRQAGRGQPGDVRRQRRTPSCPGRRAADRRRRPRGARSCRRRESDRPHG
jgi:predicted acyl esterase